MTVGISRIDARFLFTIDARCFIPDAVGLEPLFINPDEVSSRFTSGPLVTSASRATSAFRLALRPEKNTLPEYNFDALAPLELHLREPITKNVGIFRVSLERFFVSREGAIAYSFSVPMCSDAGTAEVSDVINSLTEVRRALPQILWEAVQASLNVLANSGFIRPCPTPTSEDVLAHSHSFELFDFNTVLPETSGDSRALVGFLRMTRQGVWESYSDDAVRDVFKSNLGNRNDELWLACGNRFFRMHPESTKREDVRLWFEDLHLAVTVLFLKLATLEFLGHSIRESLRQGQRRTRVLSRERLSEAWMNLNWIQDATARAADPRFFERNVAHSFFRKVLQAIEAEVGYQDLVENTRQLLADYRDNVTAMASHANALSALDVAASTEKLTRLVLWLTGAAVVVMAAQVLLAVVAIVITILQVVLAQN